MIIFENKLYVDELHRILYNEGITAAREYARLETERLLKERELELEKAKQAQLTKINDLLAKGYKADWLILLGQATQEEITEARAKVKKNK